MFKITRIPRFFSRRISSGAEYVGDIVRSLDTEIKPLQVNFTFYSRYQSCSYRKYPDIISTARVRELDRR